MHVRNLMTAALTFTLICGLSGCRSTEPAGAVDQFAALREEVNAVVSEVERRTAMLNDIDRMEAALVELGALVVRHRATIETSVRDYDTTRPQLEAAFATFLKQRQTVVDRLADAHFDFKRKAGPGEWRRLAKKERDAVAWASARHLGEAPLMNP